MKITKKKIIITVVIVAVLAAAFLWGGNYVRYSPDTSAASYSDLPYNPAQAGTSLPSLPGSMTQPGSTQSNNPSATESDRDEASPTDSGSGSLLGENSSLLDSKTPDGPANTESPSPDSSPSPSDKNEPSTNTQNGMVIDPETGKDIYLTDPVPEGKPTPVEPQNVTVGNKTYTCVLSVRCDTILNNMPMLDSNKVELVPSDGIILPPITVTFYEGESVFNVLQREMKKNRIHMEFRNTPIYNSAYIEGINNLYEFDCGELSGWMYKVNGWFPNYGCSRYLLKNGDVIEWVYTCDLGRDVGDNSMTG